MSGDKLSAAAAEPEAGSTARTAARPVESGEAGRPAATTTRRTVGVYERPAQRTKLSLPLIVILILSALVSVVTAVRFLF